MRIHEKVQLYVMKLLHVKLGVAWLHVTEEKTSYL